ncbi:MAG: type II toxin-antitoxin system VapC family toxin [Thalassotalea sp.]|nr:type II toxin-antitoxin system VapC family toxin [Thalassotalea sp.]
MNGSSQLGPISKQMIADEHNQVYVSAASIWEMSIKRQMSKLQVPDDLDSLIEELGFEKLNISLFHAEQAGNLPTHHKDPFDRMLIAQAQSEGLQLISTDEHFSKYGINLFDAKK